MGKFEFPDMLRPIDQIEEACLRHCGPLIVLSSLEEPMMVLGSATFGLLRIDRRSFIISNAHVWRFFEEEKISNPQVEIAMNLAPGLTICISDFKISKLSDDLDMVLLESRPGIAGVKGGVHFFPVDLDSEAVQAGDLIAFGGYPEIQRNVSLKTAEFGSAFFASPVTAANERSAIISTGIRTLEGAFGEELSPIKLSGMSGSPAYRISNRGAEFIGIVREGNSSDGTIILSLAGHFLRDALLS